MTILVLGRGKTGAVVAEVAREREHKVRVLSSAQNHSAKALTDGALRDVNVVMDFTTPDAVLANVRACVRAGKNMVVGTTGWDEHLQEVRELVEKSGTGLLFGANFSIGVNIFYDVARVAAVALKHKYFGEIMERHHAQKKDAPSGTALRLQKIIEEVSGTELEIVSFREGEVVGLHEVVLECASDSIRMAHDAKSRRTFAEGAVLAAEWLAGKKGFYDFQDVWREL